MFFLAFPGNSNAFYETMLGSCWFLLVPLLAYADVDKQSGCFFCIGMDPIINGHFLIIMIYTGYR